MTFDEFFKKKRIDLRALKVAQPGLFAEFKTHYELMGEKSFDHTKKYWFNKLRHQYHFLPEEKTEKPPIANPLAEQTIAESHIEAEQVKATPKQGFVPRFRAANVAKPAAETNQEIKETPESEAPTISHPVEPPVAKPGFRPRFKAANMAKPVAPEVKKEEEVPVGSSTVNEQLPEISGPKPGYKPRFNPKNIPPKQEE
jgi:hypothetical protein